MAGFAYDPKLYIRAVYYMDSAKSSYDDLKRIILCVQEFPPDYEYKAEVESVCSNLQNVEKFVNEYSNHLYENNYQLAKTFGSDSDIHIVESTWAQDIDYSWNATVAAWQKAMGSHRGDDIKEALKQTGATLGVTYTNLQSGGLKVMEFLDDGKKFIFALPGMAGLKVSDLITGDDKAGRRFDEMMDYVRRDRVGEANTFLYEHTKVGKAINAKSNLKYDSNGSIAMRKGSQFAGVVGAAGVTTIASGGTLVPVLLGGAYGAGKGAETYSQKVDREHGESYNRLEGILRTIAGTGTGALEWWGYGSLSNFAISGGKALLALKASGSKLSFSTVKTLLPKLLEKETLKTFGKNYLKDLFAKDNILATGATLYDNAISFAFGDISKDELISSIKGELGVNALLANFGAFGRTLPELHNTLSVAKADLIVKNDGFFKVNFGDKEIEIPEEVFKDYELDKGRKLNRFLGMNNMSPDDFENITFKQLSNTLDRKIKKLTGLKGKCFMYGKKMWFQNLEPNSVYLIESGNNINFRIHTDSNGVGQNYFFEEKNSFYWEILNLVYGDGIKDVKYLGKQSEAYNFDKYFSKLFYNGLGDIGINQGSLASNIYNFSKDQQKKLLDIVYSNIPNISQLDALCFLRNIDRDIGVCTYASPLNAMLQHSGLPRDKQLFRDCFGFDLFDSTGRLNEEYLLADFYSFINKDNEGMFEKIIFPEGVETDAYMYSGRKSHKNQNYIIGSVSFNHAGDSEKYADNYIVKYINSRLERGAKIHGDQIIYKYRPVLGEHTYRHDPDWWHMDYELDYRLYRDREIYRVGPVEADYSINDLPHYIKQEMKNGSCILDFHPTKDRPINMYKLTRGAEYHTCGGPHSVSIVDDVDDGFIVESWGDLYYIDKKELNDFRYEINFIQFGK